MLGCFQLYLLICQSRTNFKEPKGGKISELHMVAIKMK